MEALWYEFMQVVGERLPYLLAGLGVLVVGWCLALGMAAFVRGVFQRSGLDKLLQRWIAIEDKQTTIEPGKWVAKGVYVFVMLLVFVAFFQMLGLTIATEPLNQILVVVSDFAPRIVSALLLLLMAWVLARVVKSVIFQVLVITRADERLGESTGRRSQQLSISHTVANAAYWLVFLLFLPTVLDALALEGLLTPVQAMLNKILGFLPNVFASAVILFVGWLAARIVQQIVANVLAAAGLDRAGERANVDRVLGQQTLTGLIGTVVYVLMLIPVAIAALDALQIASISAPASHMLGNIFSAVPLIFTAGFVLLLAYFAGRFVAGLVTELFTHMGFNTILVSLGLSKDGSKGQRTPSEVVGYLAMVAIMLLALIEAARLVGFGVLAQELRQFIAFAGQVVLGLVIFGFGLYLANLASRVIRERNASQSGLLAMVARASIVVLATAMALRQMGLAHEIISLAFGLLLGAIAIAVGLAFGLGSRDIAAREVEHWLASLRGKR